MRAPRARPLLAHRGPVTDVEPPEEVRDLEASLQAAAEASGEVGAEASLAGLVLEELDGFFSSFVTGSLLAIGTMGLSLRAHAGKALLAAVMLALSITRTAARVLSRGALVAATGAQLMLDLVFSYMPAPIYDVMF